MWCIGPASFQDILGGQRDWLECGKTGQSAFCWHRVFPSETNKLQFLMDMDVNANDERVCSVFRGLLQDGFRTFQDFLLDVSVQCHQRTEIDSRRKTVGPTFISWIILDLKFCLMVNNCLIDAICCSDFWGILEKKRFHSILLSRLEIFAQGTMLINFNISQSLDTMSYVADNYDVFGTQPDESELQFQLEIECVGVSAAQVTCTSHSATK
jgi:hypothetical protein